MRRSTLNSLFFTLLYGALPLQIISFFYSELTLWFFLFLPFIYLLVKSQNYLYQRQGQMFFRRVPLFKGVSLNQIKDMRDLRSIDTSATIQRLWLCIERNKVS